MSPVLVCKVLKAVLAYSKGSVDNTSHQINHYPVCTLVFFVKTHLIRTSELDHWIIRE